MFKIKVWLKGYIKNKQKLSATFNINEGDSLFDILVLCCNEFDLPVPVILDKHEKYFTEFSLVSFSPADFVESIDYERLEVEVFDE